MTALILAMVAMGALGLAVARTPVVTGQVKLPAADEVAVDRLGSDTPVFVVRADDGAAHVLSAISPHRWIGLPVALSWCRGPRLADSVFADAMGASSFDWQGRWAGGPAPRDLTRYDIVAISGNRVTVGAPSVPVARTPTTTSSTPPRSTCGTTTTDDTHWTG